MASNRLTRETKSTRRFVEMVESGMYYVRSVGTDSKNSVSDKESVPPCYNSAGEGEPVPPSYDSLVEEGEPAPPSFYEKPAKRRMLPKATSIVKFSGEANGQPFQYTPGEKNVHLDTQAGDMSTFGRQELDIFIRDVNHFGYMLFRIRPIQKTVSYIANWIDYEMTLTETPQSLHVKGRSELGFKAKTLVENSLYGTFQLRGDLIHLEFFRDATKTTPFFTFSVRHLTE